MQYSSISRRKSNNQQWACKQSQHFRINNKQALHLTHKTQRRTHQTSRLKPATQRAPSLAKLFFTARLSLKRPSKLAHLASPKLNPPKRSPIFLQSINLNQRIVWNLSSQEHPRIAKGGRSLAILRTPTKLIRQLGKGPPSRVEDRRAKLRNTQPHLWVVEEEQQPGCLSGFPTVPEGRDEQDHRSAKKGNR